MLGPEDLKICTWLCRELDFAKPLSMGAMGKRKSTHLNYFGAPVFPGVDTPQKIYPKVRLCNAQRNLKSPNSSISDFTGLSLKFVN